MINIRLMMYQSILLSNVRVLRYLANAFHMYVHLAGERYIEGIHFVCQQKERGTSSALRVRNDRDIKNSCIQTDMPPARYTKRPGFTSTSLRQVARVIVQFFRASVKCKKKITYLQEADNSKTNSRSSRLKGRADSMHVNK